MIHLSKGDTLTKRYTYQREIHLSKGDTLIEKMHLWNNGDTLTKWRYTSRMDDTLFE